MEEFLNTFPILRKLKTTRVIDTKKSKGKLIRYKLEFTQSEETEENLLFIPKDNMKRPPRMNAKRGFTV